MPYGRRDYLWITDDMTMAANREGDFIHCRTMEAGL